MLDPFAMINKKALRSLTCCHVDQITEPRVSRSDRPPFIAINSGKQVFWYLQRYGVGKSRLHEEPWLQTPRETVSAYIQWPHNLNSFIWILAMKVKDPEISMEIEHTTTGTQNAPLRKWIPLVRRRLRSSQNCCSQL